MNMAKNPIDNITACLAVAFAMLSLSLSLSRFIKERLGFFFSFVFLSRLSWKGVVERDKGFCFVYFIYTFCGE